MDEEKPSAEPDEQENEDIAFFTSCEVHFGQCVLTLEAFIV